MWITKTRTQSLVKATASGAADQATESLSNIGVSAQQEWSNLGDGVEEELRAIGLDGSSLSRRTRHHDS